MKNTGRIILISQQEVMKLKCSKYPYFLKLLTLGATASFIHFMLNMLLYSKRPHSTKKYLVKDDVWAPYMLKHIRQVNLQNTRVTLIRDLVNMSGNKIF